MYSRLTGYSSLSFRLPAQAPVFLLRPQCHARSLRLNFLCSLLLWIPGDVELFDEYSNILLFVLCFEYPKVHFANLHTIPSSLLSSFRLRYLALLLKDTHHRQLLDSEPTHPTMPPTTRRRSSVAAAAAVKKAAPASVTTTGTSPIFVEPRFVLLILKSARQPIISISITPH
jgi:hypothetical protein